MNLIDLFPVALGVVEFEKHIEIDKLLTEHCLKIKDKVKKGGSNWESDVFNTCGSYSIFKDSNFELLNDWVFKNVLDYSKTVGYDEAPISKEAWFNIYSEHDYQETHDHIGHDVSAIYYLKVPENSGKTFFVSHEAKGLKEVFIKENPYTWNKFYLDPKPGQLIIFKSNLPHGVIQNKSKDYKISLAYNFKF
jgi:uncharacterized protein (TIGR02466 family)|tara:strand:- start:1870 stop:2445 length:576 start_codon:yes stop_codon:yes gene_type:complete